LSIKGVIFDLDGTLINTLDDLADAANDMLNQHRFPALPVPAYRMLVGAGARNLVLRCMKAVDSDLDVNDTRIDPMIETFKKSYMSRWHQKSQPYPGICDLLRRVKIMKLKSAILSNKPDEFTKMIASRYFGTCAFERVRGLYDDDQPKPDPALIREICKELDLEPGETVFVGDSGTDMITAVRAGIRPVGVLWGFRDADELQKGGAAHLFETPGELGDQLLAWTSPDLVSSR
jgi:phosphoglycolate phosphatase